MPANTRTTVVFLATTLAIGCSDPPGTQLPDTESLDVDDADSVGIDAEDVAVRDRPPAPAEAADAAEAPEPDLDLDLTPDDGQQPDAADAADARSVDGDLSGDSDTDLDSDGVDSSPGIDPWIAYVTEAGRFSQVEFVTASGALRASLATDFLGQTQPSWSPDGMALAFISFDFGDLGGRLRVMDFEEDAVHTLNAGLDSVARPDWSPDGSALVVEGTIDGSFEPTIHRVNAVTGASVQLTRGTEGDRFPHWSAAFDRVYFLRTVTRDDVQTTDLMSVSPTAGDEPETVAEDVAGDGITMGRGGRAVFYFSREEGRLVEQPLSEAETHLIGAIGDREPSFPPAGSRMVVVRSTLDDDTEIALVERNGSLVRRLTDDDQNNGAPDVSSIDHSAIDLGAE